jgi:hypothetical protein
MKVRNFKLGIVVAGLTLASLPALAQDPKGGGGPAAGGASERSGTGSVASSGGGGGGGVATGASGSGGSVSSSGGGFNSPSTGAASNPSVSFGDRGMREAAPAHRTSFSDNGGARSRTASDDGQKAQPRSNGGSSNGSGERAVPRGSSSSGSSGSSGNSGNSGGNNASGGRTRPTATASSEAGGSNNSSGAREVPTWSRPRGDHPTTGVAVDRTTPLPDRNGNYRGRYGYGGGYFDPYYGYGGYYGSYYGGGYGSPYYYPYGFGLGYGLYSGLGWYPYYGDPYGMDPYYSGYGGYGSSGSYGSYGSRDQGNLKLKVKPRSAKVYVDGYFVGNVDQFDGAFQKLPLNGGRHKVEIKADGFETAEFDVLITPEQTVTFQGELKRIQ